MFTNISWSNYIIVVALLLTSWYVFVGVRFYLDEIKNLISGKQRPQFRKSQDSYESTTMSDSQEVTALSYPQSSFGEFDTTFKDVDNLIERLKSVIAEAVKSKLLKQELIDYFRSVLLEYPSIKNSSFSSSVSEFIVSECEKSEAVSLTQAEAEALWN
ncbi:hypothetical protein ACHRV5_11060 [Flavobacterium sp. FlaQc-52]|uniref:hypothetical protein n=1 Tax=Flavobacterium sp. FlaQc-52 TaxID=3374185 RepID=UPI0037572BCC